jgi:hypothetical protein
MKAVQLGPLSWLNALASRWMARANSMSALAFSWLVMLSIQHGVRLPGTDEMIVRTLDCDCDVCMVDLPFSGLVLASGGGGGGIGPGSSCPSPLGKLGQSPICFLKMVIDHAIVREQWRHLARSPMYVGSFAPRLMNSFVRAARGRPTRFAMAHPTAGHLAAVDGG